MKCDFFIDNILPLELKAIEKIHSVQEAQLLTYLKLLDAPIGLLLNFNVFNLFKEGQKTYVNELYRILDE